MPRLDLCVISFLLLFFELAMIRWVPSGIRIVSYFSNVILISCFLGMGLGCILKSRRDLLIFFPIVTFLLLIVCRHLSAAGIENPFASVEYFFGGGGKYSWLEVVPLLFLLNALPFVCLGQQLAKLMDGFSPLTGYSLNILGSLAGTCTFTLLSFFENTPSVWMIISFLPAVWLLRRQRTVMLVLSCVLMILSFRVVDQQQKQAMWSPYYKIQLRKLNQNVVQLQVNHDYHQLILDLSPEATRNDQLLKMWKLTYDCPYLLPGIRKLKSVLILGAGTGNDVAAALRNGAERVDAVELDPMIYQLGTVLHKERPYADPRVHTYINDARNFVSEGANHYDAVIMGWVDSHRLFSSLSNARQDNFIYTVQAFQEMKAVLKEDGILCASFYVGKPWVGTKIYEMMTQAFGHSPEVFAVPAGAYHHDGQIFLISPTGPGYIPATIDGFQNLTSEYRNQIGVNIPTDDWPYLYLKDKRLTSEYLIVIAVLMALSTILVASATYGGRLSFSEGFHFFFLGAGFLLLEVKNITSLALLFGSTWLVSSVVISAILLMILFSNWIVQKKNLLLQSRFMWIFLIGSIAFAAIWNQNWFSQTPSLNAILTTAVISLTFLFAGIVFAGSFSRVSVPGIALGFNVIGSVLGGLTEYLSLAIGIRMLSVIAIGFYFAAWFLRGVADRKQAVLREQISVV